MFAACRLRFCGACGVLLFIGFCLSRVGACCAFGCLLSAVCDLMGIGSNVLSVACCVLLAALEIAVCCLLIV